MATTCPACGCVYGGKRPVQKVNRKGALRSWDKLRDVQQDICWFLYRHRLVTKLQIANAFFTARDEKNRKNSAQNHFNHLVATSLVRRLEGDKRHHFRAFYSLTDEGIYVCQAEEKKAGSKVRNIKSLKAEDLMDSPKWRHHLFLTDIIASFTAAERQGHGELLDFHGDGEMSYEYKSVGGRKVLRPDSTILWSDCDRCHLCWLELENRHSSLDEFVAKIEKYTRYEKANLGDTYKIATGQQEFPIILVVAVRRGQMAGLRQSVISGVLRGTGGEALQVTAKRIVVAIASLDDIRELSVFGDVWESPLQGTGRLHGFEDLFRICL